MTKIEIGKPVRRADDSGMDERPVTINIPGAQYSARCFFRVVNGGAVFSVGECPERDFDGICAAFDRVGPKKLARILAGEVKPVREASPALPKAPEVPQMAMLL